MFSSVSSIKTKSRNRLITLTVHALIKVKDDMKMSGGWVKFSPAVGAKSRMSSCIRYAGADANKDSTDSKA